MRSNTLVGWIKPGALVCAVLIFIHFGNERIGNFPPFGKFFNPFSGFWRNGESTHLKDKNISIPNLREPVTVIFDERAVPHIFAQNLHDLFLAQGFVTARDRLWQMQIQSRAAAGTLAEILGPNLIEHDKFQRRLSIKSAAEKDLEYIQKDTETWETILAYTEGVNLFIESLSKAKRPLEYKLLDYAPEPWLALNSVLMVKNLQWTLSGGGNDLAMSNTLAKFGSDFVLKLFPEKLSNILPVIPTGTSWQYVHPEKPLLPTPAVNFVPTLFAPIPTPSAKEAVTPVPVLPAATKPDPGNGSNNFVVTGNKTLTQTPILANDPHLQLGLPSLWYEIQLSAPGLTAYGASLPSAPGIVIGFNRKIAWGSTNGSDDVFDWYRLTFRDSTLSEYFYGGQWKSTRKQIEVIKVRDAENVLDTVIYSHQGPVVLKSQEKVRNSSTPALHALHWMALTPSNELKTFLDFMKSQNYEEFAKATVSFKCPSQNFVFASVNNDIGIFHQGQFPRKWFGQGRFILNGTDPENDWSGWIPQSENPRSKNPSQNWLYSANQSPTDSTYPYYLGSQFLNGDRTRRLGQILTDADSLTTAKAFGILLDDYDLNASMVLPHLLTTLDQSKLSTVDSSAILLLKNWNYRHEIKTTAPVLYEQWWSQLYRSIWHDEFNGDSLHYSWPTKNRTRELILNDANSPWYDDITTPAKENLQFLIAKSFREACILSRQNSAKANSDSGQWKSWEEFRPVNLRHLAQIDAFSTFKIATGGCADCVNALKESHGPSWRMVVSLNGTPQGYGIYPGGQSGNPGSIHYDDFIADWAAGRYYEYSFLQNPSSLIISSTDQGKKTYRLQLRTN